MSRVYLSSRFHTSGNVQENRRHAPLTSQHLCNPVVKIEVHYEWPLFPYLHTAQSHALLVDPSNPTQSQSCPNHAICCAGIPLKE